MIKFTEQLDSIWDKNEPDDDNELEDLIKQIKDAEWEIFEIDIDEWEKLEKRQEQVKPRPGEYYH